MKKNIALLFFTGIFFFTAVSASANPAVILKAVYQLGKEAAEEAVEKILRETGEAVSTEITERIAKEAFERAVREFGEKALKEALERGIHESGERFSREALGTFFGESVEQAARRNIDNVGNRVINEVVENTLAKSFVRGAIRMPNGSKQYISKIVNNSLEFSPNPEDAILISAETFKRLASGFEHFLNVEIFVDAVSAF